MAPRRDRASERAKFSRASTSAASALVSSASSVSGASWTRGVPAVTASPCSNRTAVTLPAISGCTTTVSLASSVPVARMRVAARPGLAGATSTGTARDRGPATSRALEAGSANRYQPATAPPSARRQPESRVIATRRIAAS